MTFIIVQARFEAQHRWKKAPVAVKFLRQYHRHEFHIGLRIEVRHDDRELEFILVKRALENRLSRLPKKSDLSCEMIADKLIQWVEDKYGGNREISCEVFEDGENGAVVTR